MVPTASAHKLEIVICSTYGKPQCIRVVAVAIVAKNETFCGSVVLINRIIIGNSRLLENFVTINISRFFKVTISVD